MRIIDVHSHVYVKAYVELLRSRSSAPMIRDVPDEPQADPRLIILPGDDDNSLPLSVRGRPMNPDLVDLSRKIAFMDAHNIDTSIISLANPWLDFCSPTEVVEITQRVNDDIHDMCVQSQGRLYAFGTLPLSATVDHVVQEVERLSQLSYLRGVILSTSGLGSGLDDPGLDPFWAAVEESQQVVFLHPHYGLPSEVFGKRGGQYGHVLSLALGFPLETTIAISRMFLSGVFERFPKLKILLAHSGGTLPFLAGRIESCIAHDAHLMQHQDTRSRPNLWHVLRTNIFLDAVIYSEVGLLSAVEASGLDRLLFGTDHPFFPPLDGQKGEWLSVKSNRKAIERTFSTDQAKVEAVMGGNASRILGLGELTLRRP